MFKKWFITAGGVAILVSCGYKGPLYLPKNTPSTESNSVTTSKNQYAPIVTTPESTAESMPHKALLPVLYNPGPAESHTNQSTPNNYSN